MRRLHWALLGTALPVFVVCLALSGCKKGDEADSSFDYSALNSSKKTASNIPMTAVKMGKKINKISGKVVWKGNKPDIAKLNDDMLKAMATKKDDIATCECKNCQPQEKEQQRYRIGDKGTVGNVVIWLAPIDKNTYFEFTEDNIKDLELKKIEIDQPHCAFIPHVTRVFTHYADPANPRKALKSSGQDVVVVNNADISHNTKWGDTGKIRGGNVLLPPKGSVTLPLVPESKPVRIQCSIHEWMDGWVWDFNHPYADVSKCDGLKLDDATYGTYEIKNVPVGVKMKIMAWQEEVGIFNGNGEEIEVSEKEPELVKDFEIMGK